MYRYIREWLLGAITLGTLLFCDFFVLFLIKTMPSWVLIRDPIIVLLVNLKIALVILLVVFTICAMIWGFRDLKVGQVKLDIIGSQLGKYLMRNINDQMTQLNNTDEKKANLFIRYLSIKNVNEKLVVSIRCGSSAVILQTVYERCVVSNVAGWLHDRFPETNWMLPEKKTGLWSNNIIIRQK